VPAEVAGTFRRLAAALYDGMLLLGVLMAVTALLEVLTHGEAITRATVGLLEYAYCALLLACIAAYFGSAWTRRGQTLGMKAWSIRLETEAGALPGIGRSLARLAIAGPLYLLAITAVLLMMMHRAGVPVVLACLAPLVLSYGWLLARRGATLHDRWSGTRVRRVPSTGPA